MKVLLINGSPRHQGCTYTALSEVAKALTQQGIESEIIWLGNKPMQDCIACGSCGKTGKCAFDDGLHEIVEKCAQADGFVFGSPVYYSHPSGRLLSFMDRLFYSASRYLRGKPAAAVVSARRAGTSASLDVIIKHFTIAHYFKLEIFSRLFGVTDFIKLSRSLNRFIFYLRNHISLFKSCL